MDNDITSFQIAATYIGTVVGAGFASGQEVLQFFGYFGFGGLVGLVLTTLLFSVYGYIILKLGMSFRSHSHREIIKLAAGKWAGLLMDLVITVFLFGAFTAMVAGSGAIFREQLGLSSVIGSLIMVLFSVGTTFLGIEGIISALTFVVPFLLSGLFLIAILTVYHKLPFDISSLQVTVPALTPVPSWLLSAVVYTSYNIIIAVAVLAPMGARIKNKDKLSKGAILGGIGLGLGAFAILLCLLLNMPAAGEYEIPMIFIAGQLSPWIQILYSTILFAEIYTTAVGNLYGFVARMFDPEGLKYRYGILITGLVALFLSRIGFSNLVHYLYPLVGYAGVILMIGLTVVLFRDSY